MIELFKRLIFDRDNCNLCKRETEAFLCDRCKRDLNILNEKSILEIKYIDEVYYSCLSSRLVRRYITEFKYNNKPNFRHGIAEIMGENIVKNNLKEKIDLIIPIPIHKSRINKRGYNQAELLAKEISKITNIPMAGDILIKVKNTPSQTKLDVIERLTNLEGAFEVNGDVKDKRILLIDDILTTGATLKEGAKTLQKAQVKSVTALVFMLLKDKKR